MACDQKGRLLDVQIFQRVRDSSQANRDPAMVAELVEDCRPNGERTINLAGLPIGLLVCGENNVLTNEQYNDNRALVRHQPDAQLFEGVRDLRVVKHQGLGGQLILPPANLNQPAPIVCRERLGGLLRFYHRQAA